MQRLEGIERWGAEPQLLLYRKSLLCQDSLFELLTALHLISAPGPVLHSCFVKFRSEGLARLCP